MTRLPFPYTLGDLHLVEPLEVKTTVRGMVRPGSQAERPREGIVRHASIGRMSDFGQWIPSQIAVGDLVVFPEYAGKEIVDPRGFPPGVYLFIRESEIQMDYGPVGRYIKQDPPAEESHE